MHKKIDCPICKKKALFVGVHDDEGNYHGPVGCEYENNPWSGLSYALHHEGWGDCPLCTDGAYSTMGGMLFDTAEDAISALSPPNEPLTLDSRLTPKMVTCPKGWKGVRDTRFYCPGCKKAVKKGEAYCHKCGQALIFPAQRYDKENNRIWLDFSDRRPPEGEENT